MHHLERLYWGDVAVAGAVIVTQAWIARMVSTRWRNSLPVWVRGVIAAVLAVLWILCGISLLITFSDERYVPPLLRGTVSAVEIVWALVSLNGVVVYYLYRRAFRATGAEHNPGRRRLLQTAAAAAIAAPVSALAFGAFIERTRFVVREVDFPIPGLHPDLEGFRIAQITDIHAGAYLSVKQVARVVDMANELKPRLALITGDLISHGGDPLDGTLDELGRLRTDAGILGCLGNHEVYAQCEDYTVREGSRRGIEFLRGESRRVRWGQGALNVAGVDFQSFHRKDRYLMGTERLVAPDAANLLLSHNPDVFPAAVKKGYDALVGGHTHGGQINVEILNENINPARFFTPYVSGLYRLQGRSAFVSAGVGTIGMPVRLGVPPEIVLLKLHRA